MQIQGHPERPRLAVYRSNLHIYAQVCVWAYMCAGVVVNVFTVVAGHLQHCKTSSQDNCCLAHRLLMTA